MVKIFGIRDSFSSGSSHKTKVIFCLMLSMWSLPGYGLCENKMKNMTSLPV